MWPLFVMFLGSLFGAVYVLGQLRPETISESKLQTAGVVALILFLTAVVSAYQAYIKG